MTYLLDTNILLRVSQTNHTMHQDAMNALRILRSQGETLCVLPQNLIEYWAVATRPVASNGLGYSFDEAQDEIKEFKKLFAILPDTAAIFLEWETLVKSHQVIGKQAHDARIAAAMIAHQVTNLLTFNTADFKRFSGIAATDPKDIK
jgi:predicted nucleic acid-binding protein